ncbi:MAG: CapA family protein [Tissierellia bacterium]|nr:CapA family protein [Tissierellia bacterium]
MRISFTGDIMCELPTLRKAKKKNNYYFDGILSSTKIFNKTDYLIGNLETVLAGENASYSNDIYSYNTPDSFLDEVSKTGFDMVSTANNHCLDRGKKGLIRTIELLKKNNIDWTGTNLSENEDRFRIIDLNGVKVGIVGYTYGSNYSINKSKLEDDDKYMVNFFDTQDWIDHSRKDTYSKLKEKAISSEKRVKILKLLKKEYNRPRIDDDPLKDINDNLVNDIQILKEKSDIVIMLMHSGGQFNLNPGKYTKELVEKLKELGVDIVIGHHPHIVQKYEANEDFFVAYSLGNYFISPDTIYLLNENLPLYSIILHLDIIDKDKYKMSFSISKTINYKKSERVVDTFDLYKTKDIDKDKLVEDCKKIYSVFTGKNPQDFKLEKEYELL